MDYRSPACHLTCNESVPQPAPDAAGGVGGQLIEPCADIVDPVTCDGPASARAGRLDRGGAPADG